MPRLPRVLIQKRIYIMLIVIFVASLGLIGRLVYLQLYSNQFFQGKAMEQRLLPIPVDARRGTIYDRNGIPLAISVSANAVYAIPAEVDNREATAEAVANILDLDYDFVLDRISKRSASEWLKKRVATENAQAILELNLPGIGVIENPERFYPYGSVAPQVLGIVGADNQGLEGIELYYDEYLRGKQGETVFERDAVGREIPHGVRGYTRGEQGADIHLTLDYYIQQIAQQEVERAARETGSRLALIAITDPKTGEILATAIHPTYDVEDYQAYPSDYRRNIAVTDTYEPGSTFKAVTASIALDAGVTSWNDHFFDPGYINVSGWNIRCWNRGGHGSQSFVETLENSCNPFYAHLGIELGGQRFYEHLTNYNYGSRMGIDFPGEAPGRVRAPSESVPLVTWANIGFGQGLTVTPLQLLASFSAIANDGILSVPHYAKEIESQNETMNLDIGQQRQVMPTQVANMTRDALRSVVENGSGRRADAHGYLVAGKTGTAQLVEGGRYSHSKTVTSFAGFAPADDPQMSGILVLWEPQGAYFGGIIAAPVFARLVEQVMPYLGVNRRDVTRLRRPGDPPAPREVDVPDVTGLTVTEALQELSDVNVNVEVIGEGNTIVGQVPGPSATVEEGTLVLIYTDLEYLPSGSDLPTPFGV